MAVGNKRYPFEEKKIILKGEDPSYSQDISREVSKVPIPFDSTLFSSLCTCAKGCVGIKLVSFQFLQTEKNICQKLPNYLE